MEGVYEWVDTFQFSRSKKNIARDFSDAVLLAELLAQLFPAWVELHNYPATNRFQQKLTNWETLNRKVLMRIKIEVARKQQEDLANAVPGAIELLLAQVRKQTAKNEQQKANFKTPSSPNAKTGESKPAVSKTNSGLMSPSRFKSAEPRNASPFATPQKPVVSPQNPVGSPRSPQKAAPAESRRPKSPLSPRASSASLSDFLPSAHDRPDHDDIAASFSKMLQLITKSSTTELGSGAQASRIVKPKTTPASVHARQPLTPDSKQTREVKGTHARARPLSADVKSQQQQHQKPEGGSTGGATSPTAHNASKAKQASNVSRDYSAATKPRPTDASCSVDRRGATKIEFVESSLVYFSCHEVPPVRDEQQAWDQTERVQLARFVKLLASGDCLVQLLKPDDNDDNDDSDGSTRSSKWVVSTPHFIECCASQLHNVQSMQFDARVGKWQWRRPAVASDATDSSSTFTSSKPAPWKRALAIDIAPSAYSVAREGPRTAPELKSRRAATAHTVTKPALPNTHFFTEVLTRVKCNSISIDEPVVVVDATCDSATSATPCPNFVDRMSEAIGFASPVAPTVFPKVQIDFPLAALETKCQPSPTSRKIVDGGVALIDAA